MHKLIRIGYDGLAGFSLFSILLQSLQLLIPFKSDSKIVDLNPLNKDLVSKSIKRMEMVIILRSTLK